MLNVKNLRLNAIAPMLANALFYAIALFTSVGAGALMASTAVYAQTGNAVTIDSKVEVERTVEKNGKTKISRQDPKAVTVVPGDRLVFTNSYSNTGNEPADNFVAVNPIHPAVVFEGVEQDWAEISVDGGKSWGKLNNMTVSVTKKDAETGEETVSQRPATAADVTHVRWRFAQAIAPRSGGDLVFRGRVK